METLNFSFASPPLPAAGRPALAGVLGSGNLEVLVEAGSDPERCTVRVTTAVRGFADTWRAVLGSFVAAHAAGGTRIAINDLGATPAVVSLRLAQALADYRGDGP